MTVTTNSLVTGAGIYGSDANAVQRIIGGTVNPSPYCKMFVPMLQAVGSGPAKDYSGNANDIALGSGAADNSTSSVGVWSDTSRELNAYMLVQADASASTKHMYVPNLTSPWNLEEWMIWSMVIKPTNEESTTSPIVRCGQAGICSGWTLQDNGSGKLRIIIHSGAGGAATATGDVTSAKTVLVTGRTVQLTVAIDPVTRNIYTYINGHAETPFLNAYTGTGTSTRFITFGSVAAAGASTSQTTMYGALVGPVHYYSGPGALPSNCDSLARRLADLPNNQLSEFELPA
jgi:hypothetical protein